MLFVHENMEMMGRGSCWREVRGSLSSSVRVDFRQCQASLKSISWDVLAVGSCMGKAPEEYGIGKPRPIFLFCFLKSKMVPGVASGETRPVSEGKFHLDMLSLAEC